MDAQLKKGILELCILQYISQKDVYGYEVMQHMHQYFPEVNESTFYAILRRLQRNQLAIVVEKQQKSNGPKRKYYSLTTEGEQVLEKSKQEWNALVSIMKEVGITERGFL